MFKCDGKNCTQIYDPKTKKIQTACPGTKCNMTCEVGGPDASCTPFVASQITQIGQKGPVTLTCLEPGVKSNGSECIMHEQLLDFFFKGVELTDCHFGECIPEGLHANVAEGSISEFALRNAQIFEETTYILAAVFGVLVFIVICLGLLLYYGLSEYYSLESCEVLVAGLPPLITQPYPCTLTFKNVGYTLKGRQILKGISGVAPAGEILAIMVCVCVCVCVYLFLGVVEGVICLHLCVSMYLLSLSLPPFPHHSLTHTHTHIHTHLRAPLAVASPPSWTSSR